MGLRTLPYKPKILGSTYAGYDVIPSSSFYYDEYAYKVVFDDSEFPHWRQRVHFKRQLEDFSWDLEIYGIRPYIASTGMRLYVKDSTDLDVVLAVYGSQITELYGPINQEHLKVLVSGDQYLLMRKTLLYKKYDCRFYCLNYSYAGSIPGSMYHRIGGKENRTELNEQQLFWKTNLQDRRVLSEEYGWQTPFERNTFYATYKEYLELLPMFKLQWPSTRIILHKVILI